MSRSNVSEQMFEKYCNLRCYPFKRIDVGAGKERLPDYEVQTPRGAVVCEVKEIRPNVEDKSFDEKLKKYRYAHVIGRPLGKRAGTKLENARGQLRRFQNDPRPCILVLLDKTFHSYLTDSEIDAAMFGDPLALFSTNPEDHRIEFIRGDNRRLKEEREIYIGALAVLHHINSEGSI